MGLNDILKLQHTIKSGLVHSNIAKIIEMQNSIKLAKSYQGVFISANVSNLFWLNNYFTTFQKLDNKLGNRIPHYLIGSKLFDILTTEYEFYKRVPGHLDEDEQKETEAKVIDETKAVKAIITDVFNENSNLLKVEPREFEEMIAELLRHRGFSVELTKQTRDNGYDIIGIKYLDGFPLKFLVECKRYRKEKVGVEIIRSFKEVIQAENANKGIIVTTSYFTRDAIKKRNVTPYLLDYRDKDDVLQWVAEYYSENLK